MQKRQKKRFLFVLLETKAYLCRMKPKKLIEVALPIKEISAESVRDKSIRHGHISTLHLWWARRPLPVCRAIVFASLVPDPLDENCPQQFRDAVAAILNPPGQFLTKVEYHPYDDIPYTAAHDPMDDNLRNRLMMFIGKFSAKCQDNMKAGKPTSPKEQLSDGSLIKWENKNNPAILRMARELIWVAYNAERHPELGYESLHHAFDEAFDAIKVAEEALYSVVDRHKESDEVKRLEAELQQAIDTFQSQMPSVFDPFAGGGAIPLEAARLGCRSYGNDINPVAHIIEKGSAEFPQKYGKPIVYSKEEFVARYGVDGQNMAYEQERGIIYNGNSQTYWIPNRLAFDVEYYARELIKETEKRTRHLYYIKNGQRPSVYQWVKLAKCSNSTCCKEVPLFKQYYFSKPRNNKQSDRIKHFEIDLQTQLVHIESGYTNANPTIKRGTLNCPYCGAVTEIDKIKVQFETKKIKERQIALVYDNVNGKEFVEPNAECEKIYDSIPQPEIPTEKLQPNSAGGDILGWGFSTWGELFNKRQLTVLYTFCEQLKELSLDASLGYNYIKVIKTYMAILIDRIAVRMSSFGKWHTLQDTVENLFGRQAIQMNFEYPELDPFSMISSSAIGQLDSILAYINEESTSEFLSIVQNVASGDKQFFKPKSITAVITDPPYYDAIAYADISDFFYVWLKRTLSDVYPLNFSTPQTPKKDECTALKHHHNNDVAEARKHFENKLLQIFDAIETQTNDIVSIMFAHQSTEAWTTLCDSILGARMNITGSWPMDTEVSGALKADKAFLESSVTVACRPSERQGFGEFKEVKRDIEKRVTAEVEYLYEMGFRGADLLTACFGQAVSEFGRYKIVEKADGSEVSVGELLEMSRTAAFNALLKGVQGDDYTRFYIGWLQMNGVGETDFDDATKFTRVGVSVDINDIKQRQLLILEGKKVHLAMAEEHIGQSSHEGMHPSDSLIDQAHRAILTYKEGNRQKLLRLVRDIAPEASAPLWRLLATMKELLPANDDLKQVQGLLQNADDLRQNCHKEETVLQGDLFD